MASTTKSNKLLTLLLIAVLTLSSILVATEFSSADTALPVAKGYIKSSGGAVLRSKASKKGARVAVLANGSVVEIKKEVFVTKKKTSATKKWYYVNTGAGAGYVRSDLIKISSYNTAIGQTTKKIVYRKGAGTKMSKKGTIKKNKTFTIVLEAKAYGSSAVWYKIKKGSKYYYVKKTGTKIKTPAVVPVVTVAPPSNDLAQSVTQTASAVKVVNGACAWAQDIADDNRFHYGIKPNSQHNGCYFCGTQTLTGGRSKTGVLDYEFSYCCNPFVHAAYAHGGNEQAMLQVCKNGSSYDYHEGRGYDTSPLFTKLGHPDMKYLKKGDVLCSSNHCMLYMGNGMIAEATGGDDNIRNSSKWNSSIRVTTLTAYKYASFRVYRYTGNTL